MASATVTPGAKPHTKHDPKAPARSPRTRKPALQYVRDEQGRPVAVVVPITIFEDLVEAAEQLADLEHLAKNDEVRGEPVPLEEVEARLRAAGKLP